MDRLTNAFTWFWKTVISFFDTLSSIISWWVAIVKALFFGLTSLLSKVWDLAVQILDWWVFVNVGRAFDTIASYIWWPATVFLASMLFLVIVRTVIAFVFKIFRLNIDYHTDRAKTEKYAVEDSKRNHNLFS